MPSSILTVSERYIIFMDYLSLYSFPWCHSIQRMSSLKSFCVEIMRQTAFFPRIFGDFRLFLILLDSTSARSISAKLDCFLSLQVASLGLLQGNEDWAFLEMAENCCQFWLDKVISQCCSRETKCMLVRCVWYTRRDWYYSSQPPVSCSINLRQPAVQGAAVRLCLIKGSPNSLPLKRVHNLALLFYQIFFLSNTSFCSRNLFPEWNK